MRKLAGKAQVIFNNNRGETLIEGLASILVFTVLIAAVTMMIMISLRITTNATAAAEARQAEAGVVLAGDNVAVGNLGGTVTSGPTVRVTIEVDGDNLNPIFVPVTVYSTAGFTAFQP